MQSTLRRVAAAVTATFVCLALLSGVPSSATGQTAQSTEDCGRPTSKLSVVTCVERVDTSSLTASAAAGLKAMRADDPIPPTCRKVQTYYLTRTVFCRIDTFHARIRDVKTGRILGEGWIATIYVTDLSTTSRKWTEEGFIGLIDAKGQARSGYTVTLTMACGKGASKCTWSGGGTFALTWPGKEKRFKFNLNSPTSKTYRHLPTPILNAKANVPAAQSPSVRFSDPKPIRCDSLPSIGSKAGGCVHPAFIPTHKISRKDPKIKHVAEHIYKAQRSRLKTKWGWKGHGPPLHRLMSKADQDQNREAACPKRRPRPTKGNRRSCDEYPFASTEEGALFNKDFSWMWVNGKQNTTHGRDYLNRDYRKYRILDEDTFWVEVT